MNTTATADPVALDRKTAAAPSGGRWVTVHGPGGSHPVFIRDGAGHVPARVKSTNPKRFTRAEVERALLDHHKATGETWGPEHDRELAAFHNPWTFKDRLPGEIRDHVRGNGAVQKLFNVSPDGGGGADAFAALGDRYLHLSELAAGSPLRAAVQTAHDSPDPEMQFLAHVHRNLPKRGEGAAELHWLNASGLRVGDRFTVGGVAHRVAEDEHGYRVLRHGHDYETPIDALEHGVTGGQIPHDAGSFRAGKGPKRVAAAAKPDDDIPFSRHWDDAAGVWLARHSFSSTHVNLPDDLAAKVLALAHRVDDADLAGGGRTTEPHVTVKYGLHTQRPEKVAAAVKGAMGPRFTLGKVSLFEADDSRPSDVLKIDVASPDLHALRGRLSGALEHTDTYPEYRLHVTLAYCKPGTGTKYLGKLDDLEGTEGSADRLRFSDQDGMVTDVPLVDGVAASRYFDVAAGVWLCRGSAKPCGCGTGKPAAPAEDDGGHLPDDPPYEPDESMLPPGFAGGDDASGDVPEPEHRWDDERQVWLSRGVPLGNCGTGAGGFQKGNTCAGGGYGADNKLRTSRTTLGNIRATGAKRTRDYTDGQGRKVVEHRTDDGRLFHEVTHANGRRAFHQVHGARAAGKAAGDNSPKRGAAEPLSAPAPSAEPSVAEFGARVNAAARTVVASHPPGGTGPVAGTGDGVRVDAVHAEYQRRHGPIDLDEFKGRMGRAMMARHFDLYREDLIPVDRQDDFRRAAVNMGATPYHWMRVPRDDFGGPATAPASVDHAAWAAEATDDELEVAADISAVKGHADRLKAVEAEQSRRKAAGAPTASAIRPDLFGNPSIDSSGIGRQSGLFHDPVAAPLKPAEKPVGSRNANDPRHTGALFGAAAPQPGESVRDAARRVSEDVRAERGKGTSAREAWVEANKRVAAGMFGGANPVAAATPQRPSHAAPTGLPPPSARPLTADYPTGVMMGEARTLYRTQSRPPEHERRLEALDQELRNRGVFHWRAKVDRERAAAARSAHDAVWDEVVRWQAARRRAVTDEEVPFSRGVFLSIAQPTAATPVPMALSGHPTHKEYVIGGERKRLPVAYFWKDAIAAGRYVHPTKKRADGSALTFDVTPARMDGWVGKFKQMRAAGVEVPVPVDHSFKAADNRGWVEAMERKGDRLRVLHAVIGDDAAQLALRNRCSVYFHPNWKDERGKEWGDAIVHSALTPFPVISGMGEFRPADDAGTVAASRAPDAPDELTLAA